MQLTVQERARGDEPLYCPKCGSELSVELLVIDDEAGRETVLCIDCPNGDHHAAATGKDVIEATTNIVMEHLRQMQSGRGLVTDDAPFPSPDDRLHPRAHP